MTGINFARLGMAVVFAALLGGFVGHVSAPVCTSEIGSDRKTIRWCTLSIIGMAPFHRVLNFHPDLFAYRGIAYANLGEIKNAQSDMRMALQRATWGRPELVLEGFDTFWLRRSETLQLLELMGRLDPDSTASDLWSYVLLPYTPILVTRSHHGKS